MQNYTKVILQNLSKKCPEYSEIIDKELSRVNPDLERILGNDEKFKDIFYEQVMQFDCWSRGFAKAAKDQKFAHLKGLSEFNVQECLESIQDKVKVKGGESNSYYMALLSLKMKNGWGSDFMKRWKEEKDKKYEERKKQYQSFKNESTRKRNADAGLESENLGKENQIHGPQDEPGPQMQEEPAQSRKTEVKLDEHQKRALLTRKQQKQKQQKLKNIYSAREKHYRLKRAQAMLRYLSNRTQFSFVNIESVAEDMSRALQKFMEYKIKGVIRAAKIKHSGYSVESAGDEFRYFGKLEESTCRSSEPIPVHQLKFFRLMYPSKLELFNLLSIAQEQKEEEFRGEVKTRLQTDKKSDKFFFQNYIAEDSKMDRTERKFDRKPNPVQRLKIHAVSVQYVVENDPSLRDSWVLERSLYK